MKVLKLASLKIGDVLQVRRYGSSRLGKIDMTSIFFIDSNTFDVSLEKNIRTHHPGNPLGMYWKRIKPS